MDDPRPLKEHNILFITIILRDINGWIDDR
jgi:hypothetical protein